MLRTELIDLMKILQLTEDYGGYLYVDGYQRPFAWEPDDVDKLVFKLMDEDVTESSRLFMGNSTIYVPTSRDHTCSISDGSQKLTICYMIACLVHDSFLGNLDKRFSMAFSEASNIRCFRKSRSIRSYYSQDDFVLSKIFESKTEDIPNDRTLAEYRKNRIYKVYVHLIRKYTGDPEGLLSLWNKVRWCSNYGVNITDRRSEAMSSFDNINSYGKKLREVEKIPVRIYAAIDELRQDRKEPLLDGYEKCRRILLECGEKKEELFWSIFQYIKYPDTMTQKEPICDLVQRLIDEDGQESFIDELTVMCRFFKSSISGERMNELNDKTNYLVLSNYTNTDSSPFRYVMSELFLPDCVKRSYDGIQTLTNDDKFLVLQAVRNVLLLRSLSLQNDISLRPRAFRGFVKSVIDLKSSGMRTAEAIKKTISRFLSGDSEFSFSTRENITENVVKSWNAYKNKNTAKTVLRIVNDIVDGCSGLKQDLAVDNISLDHINAQTPRETSYYLDEELRDNLGNLTLFAKNNNSSLKNKPFSEKKNSYVSSSFKITRDLGNIEDDNFTDVLVKKQSRKMISDLLDEIYPEL